MKIKPGFKQFILKLAVFFAIIYAIIPLSIRQIAQYLGIVYKFELYNVYISVFFWIAAILFVFLNRDKLNNLRKHKFELKDCIVFGLIAIVFYTLYFILKYLRGIVLNIGASLILEYLLLALGAIFTGLAIFNIKFLKNFSKHFGDQIILIALSGLCYFILSFSIRMSWKYLSTAIAGAVQFLLSRSFSNVYVSYAQGIPTLSAGGFSATIAAPCSGIESLLLFSLLFLLLICFDWQNLNKRKLPFVFAIGLLGTIPVSILRIYVLFLAGIKISPEVAITLFHYNIGWIFFLAYFLIFTWLAYPYIRKSN